MVPTIPAAPSVAPRRRLTAPERRARVLAAAGELFGRDGFAQVSMLRIATAAGVSNPVVYDHFASKRELYVALLEHHADRLVDALAPAGPDTTPERLVLDAVRAFVGFVEAHPAAWRMLFRDAPSDAEVVEAHAQARAQVTARIAEAVAVPAAGLAGTSGLSPERAAALLAEAGLSALDGLAGWWWANRDVERAVVEEMACGLVWGGVGGVTPTDRGAMNTAAHADRPGRR